MSSSAVPVFCGFAVCSGTLLVYALLLFPVFWPYFCMFYFLLVTPVSGNKALFLPTGNPVSAPPSPATAESKIVIGLIFYKLVLHIMLPYIDSPLMHSWGLRVTCWKLIFLLNHNAHIHLADSMNDNITIRYIVQPYFRGMLLLKKTPKKVNTMV